MENPEGLPDACVLERFSGPIEKLFAALFEEASAAQELIVNEDSLRIGFSELDTLGTGVIDTSVLLSALDKNGLQASLAEQAAKPNFEVSGLLAEEQNSKNGIALMFSQPADAAMPTDAWRLYENRDEAQNGDGDKILHIHRKSCYLFGKDRRLTDCNDEAPLCFVPIDHPTCSRQHAVIQFRMVGDVTKPYLLDLGGKNGTFVNEKRVPAAKYYELREGDLIKFAHSSKSYVLLSAGPLKSKEEKKEADEDGEIDFDVLEDSPQYADDKYEYRHVILPKRIAKDMFRIFQAEAQMRGRERYGTIW
ncbi:hypothetical protein FOZ63_018871 [Perkinsus olseni]|uniref:FHA domain-containing protein n=1 Tax=Perkinsus olseni TaxID=32597 RepID=A0A7J6QQS8_PEROL|nr:hypothetical protein FOZ63_018871 [Perkinsus olseni]